MKMKLLACLFVVVLLSMSNILKAQGPMAVKNDHSVMTTEKSISWDSKLIDLGNIQKDVATDATFEFTNNTEQPVVIARVKSSCGCTVTSYERKAILPGESASVTATYNARKVGNFRKNVTVFLSNDSQYVLSLKGNVITENVVVAK
jgi:hypothetical protein